MNFESKLKFCLLKRYFDTGLALTNYVKYLILFFGVTTTDFSNTFLIAFLYGIFCFWLGWFWLNSDFMKADTEISNRYNLFVHEVRKSMHLGNLVHKRKV